MVTLRTAARPTMHFIGVTTGASSILRVFPRWARALGLGDCELNGIDLPPRAPAEDFRAIVRFLKDDPLSVGALVTTHKLDVVAAAGDLINGLDPYAAALREVSCLSKSGSRLLGHAKDPVSSALALAAMLPEGHWRRTGAAGFVIGAGGAALAIICCLAEAERGVDRPARLVVSDRDPARLADIAATHRRLGLDLPIRYVHAASDAENAAVLPALPPHSLVINASGIGKDAPGSPLPASRAQLRRADSLVATHRVEALRRKRDATSLGSGEFRLQCCSPDTVETNARKSASISSGCSKAAKCPPDGISLQ
jgi:shikimate 5-dehydrogenase